MPTHRILIVSRPWLVVRVVGSSHRTLRGASLEHLLMSNGWRHIRYGAAFRYSEQDTGTRHKGYDDQPHTRGGAEMQRRARHMHGAATVDKGRCGTYTLLERQISLSHWWSSWNLSQAHRHLNWTSHWNPAHKHETTRILANKLTRILNTYKDRKT